LPARVLTPRYDVASTSFRNRGLLRSESKVGSIRVAGLVTYVGGGGTVSPQRRAVADPGRAE